MCIVYKIPDELFSARRVEIFKYSSCDFFAHSPFGLNCGAGLNMACDESCHLSHPRLSEQNRNSKKFLQETACQVANWLYQHNAQSVCFYIQSSSSCHQQPHTHTLSHTHTLTNTLASHPALKWRIKPQVALWHYLGFCYVMATLKKKRNLLELRPQFIVKQSWFNWALQMTWLSSPLIQTWVHTLFRDILAKFNLKLWP